MENIHCLSDSELLTQTQSLALEERRLTQVVLYHLQEIEKRGLHLVRGHSSIFDYAVRELQYSEASASRRVNAMRLLNDVKEVSQSIESGALNLCNASAVQSFLKHEEREQGKVYSPEEKLELIKSVENKSKRECEKVLAKISPESVLPKERIRIVSESKTELRILLDQEALAKLERIRALLGHQVPDGSMASLIELLADKVLNKIDPERVAARTEKKKDETVSAEKLEVKSQVKSENRKFSTPIQSQSVASLSTPPVKWEKAPFSKPKRKTTPAAVLRQVWIRDQYCCTFISPETGQKCNSTHFLQVDHRVPVAHNGSSDLSNLRLLCFHHHQAETVRIFGSNLE